MFESGGFETRLVLDNSEPGALQNSRACGSEPTASMYGVEEDKLSGFKYGKTNRINTLVLSANEEEIMQISEECVRNGKY